MEKKSKWKIEIKVQLENGNKSTIRIGNNSLIRKWKLTNGGKWKKK